MPAELTELRKSKSPSFSSVKLQLLGRRRVRVIGASVAVVSTVGASTVALVKIELGSVDKEVVEISVVARDGSAVKGVCLSVVPEGLGAESYILYRNVSFQVTKKFSSWPRHLTFSKIINLVKYFTACGYAYENDTSFIKQLTFLRLIQINCAVSHFRLRSKCF